MLRLIASMVLCAFVMVLSAATAHSHETPSDKAHSSESAAHNDCQLCHVIQQKVVLADTPHIAVIHCRVVAPRARSSNDIVVVSATRRTNGPPRAPPVEHM
ncbi:MAG: hypothetical protein SGJ05_07120 [bacterium]|nr:hypothetical protein [bacterium]